MNKNSSTLTADCPSCDSKVYFHRRPRLGDTIICSECEETLKVVNLSPLVVDWSFLDDDEDWADRDFDEYEDRYDKYDQYNWD